MSNSILEGQVPSESYSTDNERIIVKYRKNAVLNGTNYMEGATIRERDQQIGALLL